MPRLLMSTEDTMTDATSKRYQPVTCPCGCGNRLRIDAAADLAKYFATVVTGDWHVWVDYIQPAQRFANDAVVAFLGVLIAELGPGASLTTEQMQSIVDQVHGKEAGQ
jgi:hypothetical protein